MRSHCLLLVCFLFLTTIYAEEDGNIVQLHRSDSLPQELRGTPDPYFEGYIQSLVDTHFFEFKVIVLVKDHTVWLANLPKNEQIATSIISFVKEVPSVKEVNVLEAIPEKEAREREEYVTRPQVHGIWFPQMTELFLPMIAAPRQAIYSVGYRAWDKVMGRKAVAISLGDDFAIFRWLDVFNHGDVQIGIEAGIWSVFNLDPHPNPNGGTELVNTDFYVGVPITYAINKWAFRFRGYHVSGHLGDEFMVNHPGYDRKNPSYEALDFFWSYQASEIFRLYFGPGVIVHSDQTFPMKYLYAEYGIEARFLETKMYYQKLYGTCFAAAHFRNWQKMHYNFDGTYAAGYEWSKLHGAGRKIRLFLEYHMGYSVEGQFFGKRTHYGSAKFAYGF